ncbi:sodium/glutamate symporter [Arenicella sp. 4NH20-0111]|uniref:sodium/glutamate symporter n=1 Tax=Arenicella sp. 4NH20-0111 TaxID=3127648 RepID=UPI0031042CE7
MNSSPVILDNFTTFTIGILVYFTGTLLNRRVALLREFNIPEPVTGGIIASLVALAFFSIANIEITYTLEIRDVLLIYFFTAVGLNARLSDLISGGKPLIILLCVTLLYIVFQDVVGVVTAHFLGLPKAMGVLTGSASLIGGHGTAIAWAPEIAQNHGVPNALEVGVAAATLGLVMASLLGGPIAKHLMSRYKLSGQQDEDLSVGTAYAQEGDATITHVNLMGVLLVMHLCIILGFILNLGFAGVGLKLPLFVACLLVAILLSNTVPSLLPKLAWPSHTRALSVVSDFSLGLFIAMSLMSMQLWSIADLAGPLMVLLGLQAIAAVVFILFVFFKLMGGNYQAAVLSAGFAGFSLGATPTAIANMTAVTKSHGAAPLAFIILPLVGAFFVDISNAFIIQFFLNL